jgi:glutamyl-Q tRNA(Asp) synthetase
MIKGKNFQTKFAQALDLTKHLSLQQAILALGQPPVELDRPEVMLQQAVAQWDVI